MENGAFAPKEQMLHFPYYFQIHDISKASKGHYYGVKGYAYVPFGFIIFLFKVKTGFIQASMSKIQGLFKDF